MAKNALIAVTILVASSIAARTVSLSEWVPEGPPLSIHGVTLGMRVGDLLERGWVEVSWGQPAETNRHRCFRRGPDITDGDMIFVSLDSEDRVLGISGLDGLAQGRAEFFDAEASDDRVLGAFQRSQSRAEGNLRMFPDANAAVALQCPRGMLACLHHYVKGRQRGRHVYLGAVWEAQLDLGPGRAGWRPISQAVMP